MNKNILKTFIAMATLGLMSASSGVLAASVTANASADVVATLTLTETTPLAFGTFSTGTGGTVVLASDNSRTVTGDVDLVGTDGVAGVFTVGGQASTTYAITVPTSAVTLTTGAGGAGETMSFMPSAAATDTLDGTGADTFTVAGTLTAGASQVVGTYTGTYAVSVNYN